MASLNHLFLCSGVFLTPVNESYVRLCPGRLTSCRDEYVESVVAVAGQSLC